MGRRLIHFVAQVALVLFFPVLSHKGIFWRYKVMGLAFTARNRGKFKRMDKDVFLSSDLILRGPEFIEIGRGASVGPRCSLTVWDVGMNSGRVCLKIGDDTSIGEGAHITAANSIQIGNNVLFGKHITVSDNNHGDTTLAAVEVPPPQRPLVSKGPVVIEDNVWIGDKATILAGVTIGRGAIVAANSVVTHDVPVACVVAGVPARLVKRME
ncbi:acyltransferase [Mesorhizobium australicum]|uniref:Acetyltransferase (Isoleucine patch superfamily) n=1 Tax=Mesorhizobium australicum TaxID=536018 RepID=A0A1X7NRK6_9HYPH|nr:acyltransferase [Mesorhizobium australicum]SMH40664.1 Acetyltransferase (isoleucine patch superfamily) [Mesorhizobium australicum]